MGRSRNKPCENGRHGGMQTGAWTTTLVVGAGLMLASCGTYATSSVDKAPGVPATVAAAAKPASAIIVTEDDISDRPYRSLGDISVTVRKITLFDRDPTREKVADALRDEAAGMGADAVVLARYGNLGMGLFSYGQMEGKGRAVVFAK